jgi:dolichyl-phosphate-mannose-protein mannosyltransferase
MATTATPQGSLRQRNAGGPGKKNKDGATSDVELEKVTKSVAKAVASQPAPAGSERDYKVALFFITALAFLTRFWGISHPNEVVFDEVHFGKVRPLLLLVLVLKSTAADNCGL